MVLSPGIRAAFTSPAKGSDMRTTIGLTLLCALAPLASCADEETMFIEHYQAPCYGVGPSLCMVTSDTEGGPREFMYDGIHGFAAEWGHRYQLRVEVSHVSDPPADGSSLRYDLIEVVSDERVEERFPLYVSADFVLGDPRTGSFGLLEQRVISCVDSATCETVAAAIEAGHLVELELIHPADPADPLLAHAARDTGDTDPIRLPQP